MLRDAQIIGCADMPQYADMPLLPLHTQNLSKPFLKGPNNLGQLSRRLPSVGVGVSPLDLSFN